MSSSYLRDFIERELETCLPNLNPETRSRLANIAEAFVNNQISFNYALNIFTECSCPPSLITKFAHIKAVGDDPLPASKASQFIPKQMSKEFSQSSSQEPSQNANDSQTDQVRNFSSSSSLHNNSTLSSDTKRPENPTIYQANSNQKKNNEFGILNLNDNSITNNFHNSFCLTKSYTRKKAAIWTEEEDLRLLTAVSRFGNHDWRMISAFVGSGRTSSQCNQRWTRALNPSISHHPWTPQEDQKLFDLVSQMGECGWRKIASYLNGRTDLQCRHRYLQMKRTKEKEIQKENEMKLNPGNMPSSSLTQPFQNIPIPNMPQANISSETSTSDSNQISQNSYNLAPQNVVPFVLVQNNVINYNYNINNSNNIVIQNSTNNAAIPTYNNLNTNYNDDKNTTKEVTENHIEINEDLFNSIASGNNISSLAISSLPPLETIEELPFQRLPPLLFNRQSNNV